MWGRVVNKKKEQWNDKKETKKISVCDIDSTPVHE